MVLKSDILSCLSGLRGFGLGNDPVSLGMVSEIIVNGGEVVFSLSIDPSRASEMESLRLGAERAVSSLAGVSKARVVLTAEASGGGRASGDGRVSPVSSGGASESSPSLRGSSSDDGVSGGRETTGSLVLPGIDHIIAVASGKGGVGKSTTACNLALGFLSSGLRVGLLDADIYGPSLPRLMGIGSRPDQGSDGRIIPLEGWGVKVMSMGFMVAEDAPMIWRGPMVMSALRQMLRDVAWGELDILVVDMPPGTGDAQLTLAQQTPLSGAVIVSTPQDLALIDARKGLNMFRRVDVPVLGLIENMSYYVCPSCGDRAEIFGHGGARLSAEEMGVDFLGEVPLDMALRLSSDLGSPVTASQPESVHAGLYREISGKIWDRLLEGSPALAPRIVMED